MNYPGIRIEGAILSPDILERLDDAPSQRPADFSLDPAVKVKDEIARAWADAQDYWRMFQRKLDALKPDSPATTETRNSWMVPLLGLLGYQVEYQQRGAELNGKTYAISHRIANRANASLHIAGYREPSGLDRKPEKAALRMSAHALVQEYLNLSDELYGLVTNGRLLRLLRDSSRLVKLTYLEFDLDRIFTDGLFADFAILYRLLHVSRLPASHDAAAESVIERYHQDSLDSGARIREGLSAAVKQAILDFANGFLAHDANGDLRESIAEVRLKPDAYYGALLRLIYRILFLLVIEERDLVFPPNTKRVVYDKFYSLQRLRRLSEKRYLADPRRHDLWLGLLATFRLFEADGPGVKLGVAPLAGDLFGQRAIDLLERCTLGNDILLGCLRSLGLYRHSDSGQIIRVNYGALNVEEFGSVYEGLLEYKAVFVAAGGRVEFSFAQGDERSRTGSHYTPDDLVQPLIKHSLDYLIADKLKEADPERALLSLRVADIACGSGHILLAAARRIATELAVVRTGEDQPSPTAFRAAVRDVIRECIYGVDVNPLAIELCKVALWLEAHNPGQPLNFLDLHIKCGNAIVGYVRREDVDRGVPAEAFATMPGDDKEVAALFRKRNKEERVREQGKLDFSPSVQKHLDAIQNQWREVSRLPERTPAEIEAKKRRYIEFTQSPHAWLLGQLAAIPIAQFYIPKTEKTQTELITHGDFREYWSGLRPPQGQATAAAYAVSVRKRFFHWFLEFPEIIERGGFDCILGNPPYLGGQDISGTYGHGFCHYVKWEYAPAGLSDLVVYFVRRIYSLLHTSGATALIATNSIRDGAIRQDGLAQIVAQKGTINFALSSVKWPGRANLVVSLISIHKGEWSGHCFLDGREVAVIDSRLSDNTDVAEPKVLAENENRMFQGFIFLGDGFLLSHQQAETMIAREPRVREVIYPVTNGQELNNDPAQQPGRQIINFFDWPIEKARTYGPAFENLEISVKPLRATQNRESNRERWWIYAENRPGLRSALAELEFAFAIAQTGKHHAFSKVSASWIVLQTAYVFASDRWWEFAAVQSTIHHVWVQKYSGALKRDLRYLPTQCFLNFPLPSNAENESALAAIGATYHEHRRTLMRQLWLGLTDIYNLFHARELSPVLVAKVSKKAPDEAEAGYRGILELRRLHRELDVAVRDAYGWTGRDLGHDFHEIETLPENDRVRYTISPGARKEVLNRLLQLNHVRTADEGRTQTTVKRRTKRKAADASSEGLFPPGESSASSSGGDE